MLCYNGYDKALEYNREVEEKMDQLRRGFDCERDELLGKMSELKESLIAKEDEFFSGLELERMRLGALNEELGVKLREKEEKIGDLVKVVKDYKNVNARNVDLIREKTVLEEKNDGLSRRNKDLEDKFSDLALERTKLAVLNQELTVKLREKVGKRDDLGKEFKNVNVRNEDWITEKERLEAIVREKEEHIDELSHRKKELDEALTRTVDVLEKEISEITSELNGKIEGLEKENREISAKYERVKGSFEKLEEDVVEHLCLIAKGDRKFGSSKIGRILCGVMDAVDLEQECGVTVKEEVDLGGNLEEDPAIVSHANGTKSEAAMTPVISEEEVSGENGAACNQNDQSATYIQISDSDDDEASCHVTGLKRARSPSLCLTPKHDECSSSGSLNKKPKIKKLEHLLGEPANNGPHISASDFRSDHKFSTPLKKTMPVIRGCKVNLSRKLKAPGLEGNNCEVLEYMAKHDQNALNSQIDMAMACQNDPEFCVKAVCALYRNELLCSGQRGSEKCEIDRAAALAKHLVDSDPNSEKKSVDVLKQRDPGGLDTFRKVARWNSAKLFEIFKSNEDPFFSHSSRDMQYK